jgi:hypothetical protein
MNYAIYDANGVITRTGEVPEGVEPFVREGEFAYLGDATENDLVDVATGELLVGGKPPAPSLDHDWDVASRSWVGNVERARATKLVAIERARNAREKAPVLELGGIYLDADAKSTENVKVKILEILSLEILGKTLPAEQLFWKDASNELHFWPDQATYKLWLAGFAAALGSRGTESYAWAWGKKDELEACMTFEQILALPLE